MQIHMRKIPYSFDTVGYKLFRHSHRSAFRNREHRDIYLFLSDEPLHVLHRAYRNPMDLRPLDRRIDIKNPPEDKSPTFEIPVVYKRLSQMSRSYYDQIMFFIQSQYPADLIIKIFHVISISLLSKTTKIIQILSDLGCRHLHDITQLL